MWTFFIIVILVVIGYNVFKNKGEEESEVEETGNGSSPAGTEQKRLKKARIKRDRIIEQWFTLIEGAEGKGDELSQKIGRLLGEVAVPNLVLEHKNVSLGGLSALLKGSRKLLVAENKYLKGYRIFIGARDYGKQLLVSWYLVVDEKELPRLARAVGGDSMMELDIFKTEELSAFVTIVHQSLKDAVKQVMSEFNLDFTKVDTHTRGFLNIS